MMTSLRRFLVTIPVVLCLLMSFCFTASAQKYNKYEDSYNYKKGVDAMAEDDWEKAEKAFLDEINDNPQNGYAHLCLAIIQLSNEEYGNALTAANNSIKYIPKKDKKALSFAYYKRAGVYSNLDKDELALADYGTSISYNPENEESLKERASIYYIQEKYDLADKDYYALKEMDENSAMAYMGLARNEIARENFQSAVDLLDYVVALYSDYASGYSFRAEAYIGLKNYRDAANDIVKALSIDGDDKAFYLMQQVADSSFVQMNTRLKAMAVSESNEAFWPYCMGVINESTERYTDAITNYRKANKFNENDVTYYRISQCYQSMGEWALAIENIDKAIALDPSDHSYLMDKADVYYDAGQIDAAIDEISKFIETNPDYAFGYYRRGWFKDNINDIDGAIEDYTTSIELQDDNSYAIMSRGRLYLERGDTELAKRDFEAVIQKDTIPEDGSCTMFALMHLGKNEEAIDWMNKMLESSKGYNTPYEAACLYSIMGNIDKSLAYLEESFKRGYKSYHHVITDEDLENVRESEKFQALIMKYFPENAGDVERKEELVEYIEKVVEVPFSRQGGVTKVKCEINGLPLHFIFDTGASTVSISSLEATFMYKNDYLTRDDVVGSAAFIDANGDISIGTEINLRKVTFGGLELTNVRASVVANDKAPLLLGQSVLNRLGKIEIDYDRSVLKITTKERK